MSDEQRVSSNDTASAAQSISDERDAQVERLERAVAEERERSAALRTTIEELRFKTDILERSYSKQLADARQRGEAAERESADLRARLAELEAAHEDVKRQLTESASRDGSRTINELIGDAVWVPERRPAGYEEETVRAPEETPAEEMIAPDLIFTNERGDDGS